MNEKQAFSGTPTDTGGNPPDDQCPGCVLLRYQLAEAKREVTELEARVQRAEQLLVKHAGTAEERDVLLGRVAELKAENADLRRRLAEAENARDEATQERDEAREDLAELHAMLRYIPAKAIAAARMVQAANTPEAAKEDE